jgi:restriction system protein
MTIPVYQTVMLPLLRFLGDGRERSFGEAVEAIAAEFHLSPEERQQLLPSGTSTIIGNRVGWARTYMKKALLIDSSRRGFIRATERGLDVLKKNPKRIDVNFLDQFPEFVEFRTPRREEASTPISHAVELLDPEEALEDAYQRLRVSVESELLQRVRTASPAFFERLVVDLLVKMGYGGSFRDAGQAVGRSGDGELTESSKRTGWVWMLFTFRQSDGKRESVGQKYRSLRVRCRATAPARASSSQPRISPKTPRTMWVESTAGSFSSMA